jgi:4'-phosphopantetheinyl transferase
MPTDACWWSSWREIDGVVILHVELTPDVGRENRALALLDDEEKQRLQRFLAKGARCEFALCRAALRVALCERLGCSNHQLSFGYLEHGKPFAKVDGERPTIGFNVSHSGRHGLIALADNDWLGIDVEERVPRPDFDGIGSLVYSPAEQRLLAAASESQKMYLFFRMWSMKEALIKALGAGFSLNPAGFEVPVPILQGLRSAIFRFPHAPTSTWQLVDLGETRFAAALAYRLPPGVRPAVGSADPHTV